VFLIVLIGAAALGARAFHGGLMEHRLLETWPETAARDESLVKFAAGLAKPALAEHCAACHGADLRGDRQRGAPSLVDPEWLYGDGRVAEIEQTINHGIRSGDHRGRDLADMPGFLLREPYRRYHIASLSPADIRDLTAFVLGLNGRAADAAAAVRGQALFNTALCYDCHTPSAQGDPAIGAPSLKRHAWLYGDSPDSIGDVIAYGRGGVCPSWAGRLPPVTVRAIALYLHVRSGAS
jgi:cytochrome c oxidase cbb3-type subunit 3